MPATTRTRRRPTATEETTAVETPTPVREEVHTPDAILPWAGDSWPTPHFYQVETRELCVRATGEGEDGTGGHLLLLNGDETLGRVSPEGLRQLGWRMSPCPADFISILPTRLQAEVLNARIGASAKKEVGLVVQGEEFTNFLRHSSRQPMPYQDTAQFAWDTLSEIYGSDLTVERADLGQHGMQVRFLTSLQQEVTRKRGDVLGLGLEVAQDYGTTIGVNLYLQRLICLNGMTTMDRVFNWQNRLENTIDHQKLWLAEGIAEALGAYEEMVTRARLMAATRYEGDPESAIRERARAMGFPLRNIDDLMNAFNAEPGDTEWDLLNAFTRAGTHSPLPAGVGRRVLGAAGNWAHEFDMVTARLPRPMANRVGAQIIEAINATGDDE